MMAVALGGVEHLQPIEAAPGDLPDLQSLAISAQSETAVEGDPFWVEVRVSNGGAGPAGPSHAHLFLSIDDDWDVTDDYSVGEQPVEALEPGAEVQVRWYFTMPDLGTPPYTVWPVVVLDADNEVAESDENNTWKRTNAIQVSDTGEGEGEGEASGVEGVEDGEAGLGVLAAGEAVAGGGDDVTEDGGLGNAAVLGLDLTEAVEAGLVSVLQEAEGVPEAKGGPGHRSRSRSPS